MKKQKALLKKLRKANEHLWELKKKYAFEIQQILNAKRGWCGCEGYALCSACKVTGQHDVIPLVLEKFEKTIRKELTP